MSAIGRGMFAVVLVAAGWASAGVSPVRAQSWDENSQTVYCASNDGRRADCRTPWEESALVKQVSNTRCVEGRNWGSNGRYSIWVDGGCRANFGPGRGGWRGRGRDDDDDDDDRGNVETVEVRCESNHGEQQVCPVGIGRDGNVWMSRKLSNSRCVEDDTWGWDRRGIWVDQGCRAIFQVERRR